MCALFSDEFHCDRDGHQPQNRGIYNRGWLLDIGDETLPSYMGIIS